MTKSAEIQDKNSFLKRALKYYTEGFPPRSDFPSGIRGIFKYVSSVVKNMPVGFSRLLKLQPIFAVSVALLCIFLLRAGVEYIPVAFAFMAIALFFIVLRLRVLHGSERTPLAKASDFAIQWALSNILIFITPFYLESMDISSRNVLFSAILFALIIISGWDAAYVKVVGGKLFIGVIYYVLIFFSALNFVLPVLFGLRNVFSLAISGAASALIILLLIYPKTLLFKEKAKSISILSTLVLLLAFLWFGRSFVPPAPLMLPHATACTEVENREPVNPAKSFKLGENKVLYFYSVIVAPLGLNEEIQHIWYYNGKKVNEVNLGKISGGRKQGFRTWSKKTIREGSGKYTVEVWTKGGQLLGHGSFIVSAIP